MSTKQNADKQTQTAKQVKKNVYIVKNIILNNHQDKLCEIPNYARIIEDHKRNHLEYYRELQSMRATEHD